MMNKGLSKYKREKILMHFCEDIEASKTARLTGINRNTVNHYYNLFREHILSWQYSEVMELSGEITDRKPNLYTDDCHVKRDGNEIFDGEIAEILTQVLIVDSAKSVSLVSKSSAPAN